MRKKIDLTQYSLAEIHDRILNSKNDSIGAKEIGVRLETLDCYLARFIYNDLPLSCRRLRTLAPESLQQEFKKYEEPGQPARKKANLDDYSIRQIHKVILEKNTLTEAAHYFGVCASTLVRYLAKFGFQGRLLSYWQLKKLSSDELDKVVKDKVFLAQAIADLNNLPLRAVHEAALNSHTLRETASNLNIYEKYLIRYLGKYTYNNWPLTFTSLKEASVEELRSSGICYDSPFHVDPILLQENSIVKIHKHISVSPSLYYAANSLGVNSAALSNYLATLTYKGESLSFKRLKSLSLSDLSTEYPECMDLADPEKISGLYQFFQSAPSESPENAFSRSNSVDTISTMNGFFNIK